ncbi:MAG: CotH kinase family protein [Lachnospiraceae bacterium]|nr:CotH kinase family protein [Lachnospiraceae bacterium]
MIILVQKNSKKTQLAVTGSYCPLTAAICLSLAILTMVIMLTSRAPVRVFAYSVFDTESLEKQHIPKAPVTYAASPSISQFLSKLASSTTIPTVCVYTKDNAEVVSRDTYVECEVYTVGSDEAHRIDGAAAGIRVRGNSTAYEGDVELIRANQVPYRIKFEKKCSMFGLNNDAECKNWVLLKAEYDLLKSDIAFRFGRSFLRNGNFCSDGTLAHMYLNGKFMGIYELCEQHQINKNRVNIAETPEDYEGIDTGYFLELDNRYEPPFFTVNYDGNPKVTDINGVTKSLKTDCYAIKSDFYSDEQKQFITKYVSNCFKILYRACEKGEYYVFDENYDLKKAKKKQLNKKDADGNPMDPAEVVADMAVDLDSFVDVFLVYELTASRDVGEGSFFMCADFSDPANIKKLTFTCPWDFEWAMEGETTGSYAKVFNSKAFSSIYGERSNNWYILLLKQDWFKKRVCERWSELRMPKGKNRTSIIEKCIKQEKKLLKTYKTELTKNGYGSVKAAENLLGWVEKRIKWMDGEYLK